MRLLLSVVTHSSLVDLSRDAEIPSPLLTPYAPGISIRTSFSSSHGWYSNLHTSRLVIDKHELLRMFRMEPGPDSPQRRTIVTITCDLLLPALPSVEPLEQAPLPVASRYRTIHGQALFFHHGAREWRREHRWWKRPRIPAPQENKTVSVRWRRLEDPRRIPRDYQTDREDSKIVRDFADVKHKVLPNALTNLPLEAAGTCVQGPPVQAVRLRD